MNLTIDMGNTFTKVMIFNDTVPVYRKEFPKLTGTVMNKIIQKFPVQNCLLSTVIEPDKSLLRALKKMKGFALLNSKTKIPVKNLYKTPQTLGNDRLANAVAASFLFPGKNVLVIDAGTCIKFDFVNAKKEYLGGSISPGIDMRFRSLFHFTDKLPLVRDMSETKLIGNSTINSIRSGVMLGVTEEVKGMIHSYKKRYKSLKVILSGGNAGRLAEGLKISIFAAADMVNIGLNEIIRYNSGKRL